MASRSVIDLDDVPIEAVLLTSTTRDLPGLLRLRRKGLRIVQRLDGINWLHRRLNTGPRHFLRAEYGNRLLALLRSRVVTHIVYQSGFVRDWWARQFGPERVPSVVIHNGVDLSAYTPDGPGERPSGTFRLLLVEGSLQGGYETGLATAIGLAECLAEKFPLELMVVGRLIPAAASCHPGKESGAHHLGWSWCRASRSRPSTVPRTCYIRQISMLPAQIRSSKRWPAGCRWQALPPGRCPSWSPVMPVASSLTAAIRGSWNLPICPPWLGPRGNPAG